MVKLGVQETLAPPILLCLPCHHCSITITVAHSIHSRCGCEMCSPIWSVTLQATSGPVNSSVTLDTRWQAMLTTRGHLRELTALPRHHPKWIRGVASAQDRGTEKKAEREKGREQEKREALAPREKKSAPLFRSADQSDYARTCFGELL